MISVYDSVYLHLWYLWFYMFTFNCRVAVHSLQNHWSPYANATAQSYREIGYKATWSQNPPVWRLIIALCGQPRRQSTSFPPSFPWITGFPPDGWGTCTRESPAAARNLRALLACGSESYNPAALVSGAVLSCLWYLGSWSRALWGVRPWSYVWRNDDIQRWSAEDSNEDKSLEVSIRWVYPHHVEWSTDDGRSH